MRYKRFWIKDKLPNNSVFEAYETTVAVVNPTDKLVWKDFKNCIEVVDARALEACQKRLDEAVALLREARINLRYNSTYPDISVQTNIFKIDTFLSQIKDEGE